MNMRRDVEKYYWTIGVLVSFLVICTVNGFDTYRSKIPNGRNVPHPCKPNYIWQGVGHQQKEGKGTRNQFGKDFKEAGNKWTKELCQKDSDGDGMTNGQELGDPQCTWSEGSPIPIVDKITHPGVCEPLNDAKCQPQLEWLTAECETEEFKCDAIKNDADVKNMTLQFPASTVPVGETTYICMEFALDTSDDYHLIASQPVIDNANVLHRAILFGCTGVSGDRTAKSTPHACVMPNSEDPCQDIISIWTLGLTGTCLPDTVGFRIGSQGYTRAVLQLHWSNPTENNQTEQSGMVLHYTKNRRPNDAGVLLIGAEFLEIPGGSSNVEQTALCPGVCSSHYTSGKGYLVSALNHMHYLGISQKIELYRDGSKIRDITYDNDYSYDNPKPVSYDSPIEMMPGDSIKTSCYYNSLSRDNVTYFGQAVSSEMCYGFLTYYPRRNINGTTCTSWKSIPICTLYSGLEWEGCNFLEFYSQGIGAAVEIFQACSAGCSSRCIELGTNYLSHVCLQGDYYDYGKSLASVSPEAMEFWRLLEKCIPRTTESMTTVGDTSAAFIPSLAGVCTVLIMINSLFAMSL